jgi:tripartite-type tricarboxylate transporter receptor subunit TctC
MHNPASKSIAGILATALCAAICALNTGQAFAQAFPSKPVRMIVPYPSGQGADIIARIVAQGYGERLKQQVVVENRPGAGATIGVNALKQATPDGYTMGLIVSANTVAPWITKNMPFDLRRDFMPMTLLYWGPLFMVVPDAVPARSVGEFITYVKANPGKVFFGSAGVGTTNHLGGELFNQLAGINMTHVPFKGSQDAYNAMMGGLVHMYFDTYAGPRPLVEAGKLRFLGVASKERVPLVPQMPAVAESLPGFELVSWVGAAAPLGTPKDLFDKLNSEFHATMQAPEVRKRIADTGVNPGGNSTDDFSKLIVTDLEKWRKVVQGAGIKPE